MLPPSTVVTFPVVFNSSAWCRNACATSSGVTSRPSRFPLKYSSSLIPRARDRSAINEGVSRPERTRSALTALARIPSHPWSSAYWRTRKSVAALGKPIRTEIGPRIDGLLGDIEQKAAAGFLRQHDPHRSLRNALMPEEIELETLAQYRFIDLADPALPSRACVGDQDVEPAECFDNTLESARHRFGIGDIAFQCERLAPIAPATLCTAAASPIEQRELRTCGCKRFCGCCADSATGAGDDGDLTGEGQFLCAAEL